MGKADSRMIDEKFENILPFVDKPGRYLGLETNVVKKAWDQRDLHIALAFPDLYEIGTSHFGLQILYHILNKKNDVSAERVFAPAQDMAQRLRSNNLPLLSLESRTPLKRFDIIGFSLLYELNYTNVLLMLDLAGIPFFSSQRDLSFPLIIAGGPCTCNPEPVADFFDAMVIGDGEQAIAEICAAYLLWVREGEKDKNTLLTRWSEIQGVYIPCFFDAKYAENRFQTITPKSLAHVRIKRAIIADLDQAPFPKAPVVPFSKPIHDRLRLEVFRGCTRGCRFCQAGMIYRPVRERSLENLLSLAESSLASTGYEDLSLLSLSTGDYSCIVGLMEALMEKNRDHPVAFSLPSLRAETLTPQLMNLIRQVRKTGFTIAPEAGSQRLRDVINKNISEKDIVSAVSDALFLGWQVIKLYFMIGLPTETDDDISDIVSLVKGLRKIRTNLRRPFQLNVSAATFIPKPHTPFQWEAQASLCEAKEKLEDLKRELKLAKIQLKWQAPETSILEGLFARGDRRLSRLLVAAYAKGCQFDGWSDFFNFNLWREAIEESGVDADSYTTRKRNPEEPLPWDHIDIGVSQSFLLEERQKALLKTPTPDCRRGDCVGCGVCDFNEIRPRLNASGPGKPVDSAADRDKKPAGEYVELRLTYIKTNGAKYLGHLETMNLFIRAVRRAGIRVKYSEGYHPKPRIAFEDPLPIGMESLNEVLYLTVLTSEKPLSIQKRLNDQLPAGISVKKCEINAGADARAQDSLTVYRVELANGVFCQEAIDRFTRAERFSVSRVNQKGNEKIIDLKAIDVHLRTHSPNILEISMRYDPKNILRPADVLRHVLGMSEQQQKSARVIKY
jgi:radical SAM family uncharacterized protein/radical SAM-linked protein